MPWTERGVTGLVFTQESSDTKEYCDIQIKLYINE